MEHTINIKCLTTTTDKDGSIYGKFVLDPLEPGYGITLGNAMRRILLSSMEGAAITGVRIEGATHEFTTLPGVREDVLDVLLNFKGVVIKAETPGPHIIRLDVTKAGLVTASDIQPHAELTIINPDWPICTLAEGASLHVELTVETGKGYVPAEQNAQGKSVDNLPLDAAFMPIRRVAYQVDSTRVGQRTDFDSLTLEIWSNGSLDVTSALSQSANLLIEHLVPIASLSGIPTVVALAGDTAGSDIPSTSITIEDLELSVRAFNCLKRANIHSMQELLQKSEHDLLNIKNFGKKSSDEVIERLQAFGLDLKPSPEGVLMPLGD